MQIKEENGSLICLKHNQLIKQVALGNEVKPQNQMLYCNCKNFNNQSMSKDVNVEQTKELINLKVVELNQILEKTVLEPLKELSKKMIEYRYQMLQNLDAIARTIEQWINELYNNMEKCEKIDQMVESQELNREQFLYLIDRNSKPFFNKVDSAFQRLITNEGLTQCYDDFISIHAQLSIQEAQHYQISQTLPIDEQCVSYDLKNRISLEEDCHSLAFNNNGSIMISGADSTINIWHFIEGELTPLEVLKSENHCIQFLRFSKKYQWFISGDSLGQIQSWKQDDNNLEWRNNNIQKKHSGGITGILLNSNENQLFTCSQDNLIIVWQAEYETNQIEYKYTLENIHKESVNCISLNQSETHLVSCSRDSQLILWGKESNEKWICTCIVIMELNLLRICFIDDDIILCQMAGYGYINVFKVQNQVLQEINDQMIELNNDNLEDDYANFPTIYNWNKQVVIQKSSQFIYLIRKVLNEQFQIVSPPIDCKTNDFFGTLTEDGNYLVIWNNQVKEFRIYNLTYDE